MTIAQSKKSALPICMEIESIPRLGNTVPNAWYQHLKRDGGKKQPKANLAAITILAEILWWYRPTEARDQSTGEALPPTRKFSSDKLQLSYGAMANKFGMSKRQATDACKYLENHGLISLEFRTIALPDGRRLNNVLYIEPVPSEIAKISLPLHTKEGTPITNKSDTLPQTKVTGQTNKAGTNTENTNIEINIGSHQPTNNPETAKAGCMVGVTNIFSRAEDDQTGATPTPSKKAKPHRKERAAKPHISTGYTPKEWGNATAAAKALVTEWKEELGLRLSEPLVAACVGVGISQAHHMANEVFAADWVHNPMGLLITKLKALNQDPIGEHKESLIASVDNALWQIEESAGLQYEMVSDSEYLYAMPGDEEWTREKRWILPAGYTWPEEESA